MPNAKIGGTPDLKRITINLVPKSYTSLKSVMDREQVSQSDAVNMVLQRYDKIASLAGEPGEVFVPDGNGGLRGIVLV